MHAVSGSNEAAVHRLFAPVDIASIVTFRIAFGAIMLIETFGYLNSDLIATDFIGPAVHFPFVGFEWVRSSPGEGMWLAEEQDFPLIGQWFDREWMVYLFSYGGLIVDLLGVPLLLWRPTRLAAFIVVISFHLINATLFQIGIFPWFMIAATVLFFPPDLPRTLVPARRMRNQPVLSPGRASSCSSR